MLRRTISYHDYKEDFYHAFLAGIFTGAGYMVDSNKEHGEGRSDVVVYDSINGRVAIFEAKYTKSLDKLESECDATIQQIDDRMYAKEYEDDYDQILCYGISFFKKLCMVKKKHIFLHFLPIPYFFFRVSMIVKIAQYISCPLSLRKPLAIFCQFLTFLRSRSLMLSSNCFCKHFLDKGHFILQ